MGLLQVFESRELFVKILSQIKHLLRDLEDLLFLHFADFYQTGYHLGIYELFFLQLLADFEGYVDGPNS